MKNKLLDEDTLIVYNVHDIQRIFKCGLNQAYDIMRSDAFPSFRINRTLYVYKNSLDKWLKMSENRDIIL